MLKNENIICISSIDWDFIWQGHQEIMSTFAKNGNRVLFIENTGVRVPNFKDVNRLRKRIVNWFRSIKGFRNQGENLFIYSPVILPFPYSRIARWINRHMLLNPLKKWMKAADFYQPIIWTFLPTGTALDIIDNIDKELLVYYCIADFYKLVDNPKKVKKTEDQLLKKCDLVFVQGEVLEKKCRRLNKNIYTFPFGVNIEVFDNFEYRPDRVPEDIKDIKKPIIGYIGGIHRHIDFKLIRFIAETHPEWSIVLIGPVQTDISEITGLPNIFVLGKKDFAILPNYINEFDVGIIPYVKSEYTATVYPTKLNEYHVLGKPVVSTDIEEVIKFNKDNENLVLIGTNYEKFTNCVSSVLVDSNSILSEKRISSAKQNNWIERIEAMSNLIQEAVDKKSNISLNWQDNFLRLYQLTRRKFLKLAFICLSCYILIFYTPLVWLLASPLKITQKPQRADAIVVFAGGVGESGKPGQGYEERVQYAVELYKKGYASNLIFSSGYIYAFKEPTVMKALAVSLGVSEKAIILENKASNTYENVKFSKEILDKNNWNEVLLVSSPYHMRRVFFVCNKLAKEIKFSFTPIPKSIFYSHENLDIHGKKIWKKANLQQIKAILHEYVGIIYYWWKGWI